MNTNEHAPSIKTAYWIRTADLTQPTEPNTQAFMEHDTNAQIEWLVYRAKVHGYADLDDLFRRAPAVYTQLAVTWRQTHPLPAMA